MIFVRTPKLYRRATTSNMHVHSLLVSVFLVLVGIYEYYRDTIRYIKHYTLQRRSHSRSKTTPVFVKLWKIILIKMSDGSKSN